MALLLLLGCIMFHSNCNPMFRSKFSEEIFQQRYAHPGCETWSKLAETIVHDVCDGLMPKEDQQQLVAYIRDLKFIPGGRYLYYAGRNKRFYNNCFALKALEDTREDWADLSWRAERCLLSGGGIGVDYSAYRPSGARLQSAGGFASGPLSKMNIINEICRNVMRGGEHRGAVYASLNWQHGDIHRFLEAKNWQMKVPGTETTLADLKRLDFKWPAPLDMTNLSINYDTNWLENLTYTSCVGPTFLANVRQALSTGEPGFSFNFHDKEYETLRNACGELTSADDSDVCNLGSLNLSRIESCRELADVTTLAVQFLVCGTLRAQLPYREVEVVRAKNRRLGLGLMGVHEWLLQRQMQYEITPELRTWLLIYHNYSTVEAHAFCDRMSISASVATRAIAPTGTIATIAGTTTGIEPIYAVAYKQRYLKDTWHYSYVIDHIADQLIQQYSLRPDEIETALSLDYERRIRFQAEIQDYVDQGIASTINLPAWGTEKNNEDTIAKFSNTLARYSNHLRGITCYPDGARGGQPLTAVSYDEALKNLGHTFKEHDVCYMRGGCGA